MFTILDTTDWINPHNTCEQRAFLHKPGALEGMAALSTVHSHATVFGIGSVVCALNGGPCIYSSNNLIWTGHTTCGIGQV